MLHNKWAILVFFTQCTISIVLTTKRNFKSRFLKIFVDNSRKYSSYKNPVSFAKSAARYLPRSNNFVSYINCCENGENVYKMTIYILKT